MNCISDHKREIEYRQPFSTSNLCNICQPRKEFQEHKQIAWLPAHMSERNKFPCRIMLISLFVCVVSLGDKLSNSEVDRLLREVRTDGGLVNYEGKCTP